MADNIKRVRALRSLNYTELSRKMTELGRPISALAIRRIEEGDRRVDVDDLIVLAAALETAPAALLSPDVESPSDSVEATGIPTVEASRLWDWYRSEQPLSGESDFKDWIHSQQGLPEWRRQQIFEGYSKIIEINLAEIEAREGDSAKLNRLLEEHRKSRGDD